MQIEIFLLVQWVTLIGMAVGLGASWGSLKSEVKHLKDKLEDKDTGLSAIKACINTHLVRYAGEMGNMEARVKNIEKAHPVAPHQ